MSGATGPVVVPGRVSVILLNYKGADDTIACLRHLADLDWPAERLEIICVDNASGDGSLEAITAAAAGRANVQVVDSGANLGFAGGCNFGADLARGEFLAFINNDARPDAGWVKEAVAVFDADPEIASVASKVLNWEGTHIDYVDGSLTWYGMGYKRETEARDEGAWDRPKDVLFGTGSAVFVRAEVFRAVGGFDDRFFMFFEDVDLGWRLNVLGYRVRYVPESVVFHKHHATMNKYGNYREAYLLERNALLSMYKNYDDESLARCFTAAMALSVRRSVARTDLDARMLDLQVRPGGDDQPDVTVPKMALTGPLAIDYFVEQLPSLHETRTAIQGARKRSDAELFPLFRQALEPAYPYPSYVAAHSALAEAFGVREHFQRRRRVVVVTGEPLGTKLAGPAIRAVEMCRVLSAEHEVKLVTLGTCDLKVDGFDTLPAGGKVLRAIVEWADVVVFQGLLLSTHPWIAELPVTLVADIYDPFHLETLEQERSRTLPERRAIAAETVEHLNFQLARADFFLCASDKQRDFWLGQLAGQGRVNPLTYDQDESLRALIDVVPFGLADAPPKRRRHALRGTVPGIGMDDKIVLWGGGVYNWFDPLTVIAAIDRVRHDVPSVRLVFMGMKHPNPGVPEMAMADQARALSDELGLTGRHVFFNETWVPYDERADVLLDADLGVSAHFDHVETEFSFRTRILDYLWAGLPIVCTDGDSFGRLVREEHLGEAVPPRDVEALATAITRLLADDELRAQTVERVHDVARRYTWTKALAPLVRFVRNPGQAPDIVEVVGRSTSRPPLDIPKRPAFSLMEDISLTREYLRQGGMAELGKRVKGRVRRVARESRDS